MTDREQTSKELEAAIVAVRNNQTMAWWQLENYLLARAESDTPFSAEEAIAEMRRLRADAKRPLLDWLDDQIGHNKKERADVRAHRAELAGEEVPDGAGEPASA